MKRVLVIDESNECQNEIRKIVGEQFYLTMAGTVVEANRLLEKSQFDLVILETNLPDGDGFQLCANLKSSEITRDIPVIFLSDNQSVSDKVKGFTMGADDYVVKPFEPLELEVRMHARLRKSHVTKDQEQVLQKGDLILSVPYQKAILKEVTGERDLRLTPTEFRLLYFFIKNEGQILTRSQLLSTVWSDDVHVLTRTIDKHISTLKKKLASRSGYIQSVHSRGYRFNLAKNQIREAMVEHASL